MVTSAPTTNEVLARRRQLTTPEGRVLQTPAVLLPTYRGQIPYIPASLVPRSDVLAYSVCAADLAVINPKSHLTVGDLVQAHPAKSFAGFAGLPPNVILVLVLRGAGADPPVARIKDGTVTLQARAARVSLSSVSLTELHRKLQTDFVEAPNGVCKNPRKFVEERSNEMRRLVNPTCLFSGSFINCESIEESVGAGVSIGGCYSGESLASRIDSVSMAAIKGSGVVFVPGGPGDPGEILALVEAGADIIEARYPFDCATRGEILDFDRNIRICVRDAIYARQGEPLAKNCCCEVCANYTRAYVHHLYAVHEMLAPTLVARHNLYSYIKWMRRIRNAIETGGFQKLKEKFFNDRASMVAQGTARGVLPM